MSGADAAAIARRIADTDVAAIVLRARFKMSGTDAAYGGTRWEGQYRNDEGMVYRFFQQRHAGTNRLRACYAMSSTDMRVRVCPTHLLRRVRY
eukprot:3923103-Rhodomonas_salina.2